MKQIKELKEELDEKNKDKNLMELNEEKNKNYIDFIKIENNNLKEDEKKYKKKILDLSNQINILNEEKQKNMNLSQKMKNLMKKIKIWKKKFKN